MTDTTHQMYTPVKMVDGKGLLVRSTLPEIEFASMGGCRCGFRYEWEMSHFMYVQSRENVMAFLGLTDEEYDYWDSQFTTRFHKERSKWSYVE